MSVLVADQLYERYQYQRTALARQFPFMMGNNVWKGGGELNPNEQVGDALWLSTDKVTATTRKHGTRCMKR